MCQTIYIGLAICTIMLSSKAMLQCVGYAKKSTTFVATMKHPNLPAHAALLAVNTIYAINFVVAKEIMPAYIQPFGFIVIRVGIATLLFWLTDALRKALIHKHKNNLETTPKKTAKILPNIDNQISNKDRLMLVLCGLFGVAINQMLFFKGLSLTSPIHGALIMITTPILVLIIGALLIGGERFRKRKAIGVLLGLVGATMIILQGMAQSVSGKSSVLGDFCIFLNAASYGFYLVLAKPLMARYHFLSITKWTFLIGFILVLPFGYTEFNQIQWHTFHAFVWFALGYVVFMVTFMAYLLNSYALRSVNASVVSTYIYTQPLLTTLLAVLLGKDYPTLYTLLAGLIIFIGVYMVSKPAAN